MVRTCFTGAICLLFLVALAPSAASDYPAVRRYIKKGWSGLKRSNATLVKSAADSKIARPGDVILYVPSTENPQQITARLKRELLPAEFAKW